MPLTSPGIWYSRDAPVNLSIHVTAHGEVAKSRVTAPQHSHSAAYERTRTAKMSLPLQMYIVGSNTYLRFIRGSEHPLYSYICVAVFRM